MNRSLPIAVLAGALFTGQTLACACSLQKVEIAPVAAENGDTYHGTVGGVEVLFHNDVKDHPVTLFPEPPMTVRHLEPAAECVVDDGGVWGRDGVWLSGDGRTLVTTESSGSALDLVFRDTRTCAKVGRLDVAGFQWRVDGKQLVLDGGAGKHRTKRVPVDAACRPASAAAGALYRDAYPKLWCGSLGGQAQSQSDKSVGEVWSRADRDSVAYHEYTTTVCKA